MLRTLLAAMAVAGTAATGLMFPAAANAQSLFGSSGSGSGGGTSGGGASAMGSTGTGGSMGSSGSGSSGGMFGSSGSGGSGTGAGGQGGNQMGMATSPLQSSMNTQYGAARGSVSTSGFLGTNDTSQFIGTQSMQQAGRNSRGMQNFSQLQNLANQNGNNGNNAANTAKQRLRPRVQLGFEPPVQLSENLQTTLQTRLISLPAMGTRADGVSMTVGDNGFVTLAGKVASEDDRRMMEILTRMEPGVRNVKNDLKIAP